MEGSIQRRKNEENERMGEKVEKEKEKEKDDLI